MYYEILLHALALDLPWLVQLFFSGIVIFFMVYCFCYFFWGGKNTFIITLIVALDLILWGDFEFISGTSIYVAEFMAFFYLTKFLVLKFAESNPLLGKNLVLVSTIQGMVAIFIFNAFMR